MNIVTSKLNGAIFYSAFWNDMFGVVGLHVFTILDFALIWFTVIFQFFSKNLKAENSF